MGCVNCKVFKIVIYEGYILSKYEKSNNNYFYTCVYVKNLSILL